jgi:hypothetical protein
MTIFDEDYVTADYLTLPTNYEDLLGGEHVATTSGSGDSSIRSVAAGAGPFAATPTGATGNVRPNDDLRPARHGLNTTS